MATSSITKSFVVTSDQAETFVNAIEESAKNRPINIPVSATMITDNAGLAALMEKWEKSHGRKQ